MALSINSNIASLNAQRNLSQSQGALNTSLQRLSSGLRINSARDDAAGLAISERFTTQINGLNQAARNASDGISLAQTAEGDLSQITNNLQRIRELAVQSANATNSASDRAALQQETSQLIAEIDRVASTSSFNSVSLLNGNFSGQQFQVGANAGQTVTISTIASARTSALGQSQTASRTAANGTGATQGQVAAALSAGDLTVNGFDVGAVQRDASLVATAIGNVSSDITASATNVQTGIVFANAVGSAAVSAIATSLNVGTYTVAAANNAAATTEVFTATADVGVDLTYAGTGTENLTFTVAVAGGSGTDSVDLDQDYADNTALLADLNSQLTDVTASIAGGKLVLTSDSSGAGAITVGSVTANGGAVDIITGSVTTTGADAITDNAFTVNIDGIALYNEASTINGTVTGAELDSALTTFLTNNTGYSITSGTFAGGNLILAKADGTDIALNITSNFTTTPGAFGTSSSTNGTEAVALGASAYNLTIDGTALDLTADGADGTITGVEVAARINALTGYTSSFSTTLSITKTDGSNIVLTESGADSNASEGLAVDGSSSPATETYYGKVSVTSSNGDLVIAGATATNAGFLAGPSTYTAALGGTTIANTDISSLAGANAAITSIDNALTSINNSRASLGAIQNRFDSIVSSIETSSENLSAARSRIRDADFAQETASLIRNQILQQAGVSILSQANSLPQLALSLLQ